MKKQFLIVTVMVMLFGISINTDAQPTRGAKLPTGKKFIIQSAVHYGRSGKGCWEKPGGGSMAGKGENIRIWNIDNAPTKRFTLVQSNESGWYEIYIGDIKTSRIDVSGGKLNKGDNVHIWERNRGKNQKFLFKHLGGGRYKIYTKNGRIINLKNQGAGNGTNVQIWNDHNGLHNEWYLLDNRTRKGILPIATTTTRSSRLVGVKVPEGIYQIQSAMSYGRSNKGYLHFPGSNWYKQWISMSNWTNNNSPQTMFHFHKYHNNSYYTITAGKRKYRQLAMDCKGGKTSKGTPIHSWKTHNGTSQQFSLKHLGNGRFKIYHRSGKVVCLKDNKHDNNGNKVHLWNDHNAITTEWYLINIATKQKFVP